MKISLSKLFLLIILLGGNTLTAQVHKKFELIEIKFEGNNSIPTSSLEKIVTQKASPSRFLQFLNNFTNLNESPIYFDSLYIPGDIEKLKNFYRSKGFFKSEISASYKLFKNNLTAILIYNIKEKAVTRFNKFSLTGLQKIPELFKKDINEIAEIDTDLNYSAQIVGQKRNAVISFLKDHGYMLATADKPLVEVDTLLNKADVTLNLNVGKRFKISKIKVVKTGAGASNVKSDLLKKIAGIELGSYYSQFDINRAQVHLYRTNLFTSVLVSAIISDTLGNTVPIEINGDIGKMNELSPEIIINNEDNAFNLGLKLGFARKNFLGDARNFTLSSSAAAQNIVQFLQHPALNDTSILGYADARLGFEQPFLFGKPITTKLITYVTLQKRRDEYNASILGTKLTFNFELPKYTFLTSLTAYLNWERAKYLYQDTYIRQNLKISFVRELKSSSNKIDSLVNSFMKNIITDNYTTNNTIFGVDLNAVKTNSIVFPTKGYTLNLLLEDGNSIPYLISKIGGFRWSSPEYFKVLFTSTYYFPVYHENTSAFGIKFKVGNIFNYKGNKADIPLNQRFYSGGSNSVRGWRSRQLVPRNPVLDVTKPSEDFNAVLLRGISPGGYFLLEGSIETRNRLIGKIGSAVFIDYGNTWNKAKNFRFDQLAVAAGFGFRYYTQFVPLRIDFGFKIYDPFDKRSFVNRLKDHNGFWNVFQFHLGIGEAF